MGASIVGSPSLYAFTSFTFTNVGITGRYGPTLTNTLSSYDTTTYSWLNNTNYFNVVTQGYQLWTVPSTGTYTIEIAGSRAARVSGQSYSSGNGAIIKANLSLTAGDKIEFIIGQYIDSNNTGSVGSYFGLGGGGGTFVYNKTTSTLLMAAGGGGGAAWYSGVGIGYSGLSGTTYTSGTYGGGGSYGPGGSGGSGGTVNYAGQSYWGGAGAGFLGNGQNGNQSTTHPFPQTSYFGEGGYRYAEGFYGGDYNYVWGNPTAYASTHGGFGGGGGGNGLIGGGGGGGYSGGGCGGSGGYVSGGGGGGSYIISTATSVSTSNGLYDGSSSFNGSAITNLNSYRASAGYATVTKV